MSATYGETLTEKLFMNPFLQEVMAAGGMPMVTNHVKRKPAADTIEDARGKAVALLQANKDWHQTRLVKPSSDLVKVKHIPRVGMRWTMHIKYANRKLLGWADDGGDEWENIRSEDLPNMFDALMWEINAGHCDAALQVTMDDIVRMRQAKKAVPAQVDAMNELLERLSAAEVSA